jgi:ketosteroid isomerase-like protein
MDSIILATNSNAKRQLRRGKRPMGAIFLALAGVLITCVASANDKSEILGLIAKWNDLSNRGDEQGMAATCTKEATVVDDLPPYEWRGPGACENWQKSADEFVKKESMTDIVGGIGNPTHVLISGDQAYVVIPATFAYTQGGKKFTEYAVATFTLKKKESTWLITSWVWAKQAVKPLAP